MTSERFPGVVPDGATAAAGGKQQDTRETSEGAGKPAPPGAAPRPARSPASRPTTPPSSARSARKDGKAAIVTAYIKGNGEGERILDPVKFWRDEISDPGGGLEVEDHRRRRLLRRRDRSLRRHQRHPAAGRAQPRDLPADRHLPLADVLLHPADRGDVRGDALALDRLRSLRAGRDDQRPVELDHVGPGPRRRHRLRAAAGRPLPRGAPPHRRQVPGDAHRARIGRPGDLRLGSDRYRRPALPDDRQGQRHRRARARSPRSASPARRSRC